ncbi:MAG: hypothetical protein CMH59_09000 [Myxococcales bacterium]|nr:hypothetical protein [Myxococcales bacterium]
MRLALVLALLAGRLSPCGGTTYQAQSGTTTPALEPAPAPSDPAPVARIQELERRCRSTIPATTFQDAAEALSRVRAAIGRMCSIELIGDTPLQWIVSCGSDDLFASGRHTFDQATECEGGDSAFECLGAGLREMASHLEHVDVAVIGHVDLQLPRDRALSCEELLAEGWATPPWAGRIRGRMRDREAANDRLAWCRAARAAAAVKSGLGPGAPVRTTAVGASSSWLRGLLPDPSAEGATCPAPVGEDDEPAEGKCQAARRVDVLVRLEAEPSQASTECTREGNSPADVLYCLEACAARPEQSQSALANPSAFFGPGGTSEVRPRRGWYLTRSRGAPAVDLDSVLRRFGVAPSEG